jgi:hypothetical protein
MLSGSTSVRCAAPGVGAVADLGDESPGEAESAVPRLVGIV